MDLLPSFLNKLKPNDTERIAGCLDFLTKSLADESRWVKNQAFSNYGKSVYEVYLKLD